MALSGLSDWERDGLPPKPMMVNTKDNPFNFRGFANTLHNIGVGISSLRRTESGAFTFQPKPYHKNAMPMTPLDELREIVNREIADIPPEIRALFNTD